MRKNALRGIPPKICKKCGNKGTFKTGPNGAYRTGCNRCQHAPERAAAAIRIAERKRRKEAQSAYSQWRATWENQE